MKKAAIIAIAICMIILTVGCSHTDEYVSIENDRAIKDIAASKKVEDTGAFLELHFQNGEIYRTKIAYIYYPNYYNGEMGGNYNYLTDSLNSNYSDPSKLSAELLQNSGAVLENGWPYSFSEAITLTFDKETKTVAIYLWRDTPYKLEQQVFEKIERE